LTLLKLCLWTDSLMTRFSTISRTWADHSISRFSRIRDQNVILLKIYSKILILRTMWMSSRKTMSEIDKITNQLIMLRMKKMSKLEFLKEMLWEKRTKQSSFVLWYRSENFLFDSIWVLQMSSSKDFDLWRLRMI
jgi:hypothetical protein